jgi:hypothetical protein
MSQHNEKKNSYKRPYNVRNAERQLNGIRRNRLLVNLTNSERVLLEEKAKNLGWTMSRTLVNCTLHPVSLETVDTAMIEDVIADLRDYRRKLSGIANNLNQLTKFANAKGELPRFLEGTLEQVRSTVFEVNDILVGVRR